MLYQPIVREELNARDITDAYNGAFDSAGMTWKAECIRNLKAQNGWAVQVLLGYWKERPYPERRTLFIEIISEIIATKDVSIEGLRLYRQFLTAEKNK